MSDLFRDAVRHQKEEGLVEFRKEYGDAAANEADGNGFDFRACQRALGRLAEGQMSNIDVDACDATVAELEKKGPFASPLDLTRVIAEHIRAKMKYDLSAAFLCFSGLFRHDKIMSLTRHQADNIVKLLETSGAPISKDAKAELEMKISPEGRISSKDFRSILASSCFGPDSRYAIGRSTMESLRAGLGAVHMEASSPLAGFVGGLRNALGSGATPASFQEYLRTLATTPDGLDNFSSFVFECVRGSSAPVSVDRAIEDGVGVCRHFSAIEKGVYNRMAKTHFPNSEMLFVSNFGKQHAYNLLMWEDRDGKIQKKYVDVTEMVTLGNLFPEFSFQGDEWYANIPAVREGGVPV